MSSAKTSMAPLVVLAFAAGAGAPALACDWHERQVQAQASTPLVDEPTETSASPIDPVLLARIESLNKAEATEQE